MKVTVKRKTQCKGQQCRHNAAKPTQKTDETNSTTTPVATSTKMSKTILVNILGWCSAMSWFFTVVFIGTTCAAIWNHQTSLIIGGVIVTIFCAIIAITIGRLRRAVINEPDTNAVNTFAAIGALVTVLQFIVYVLEKLYSITT